MASSPPESTGAAAAATATSSSPSASSCLHCCQSSSSLSQLLTLDKYRLEVLARTAVMLILGLSLATANIPHLVPPSTSFMIGIMVASLPLGVPKFLVLLLTFVPVFLGMMITMTVLCSMILACINVSVDFMTIIYSVMSLVLAGLFFGKTYAKLSGFASGFIAIPGMLVVSFFPLVSGGGLTVADLWTESGTQNHLAVFRNFLICVSWAVMAIIVGVIIPPFRTLRKTLSSKVVPKSLLFLVSVIEKDDKLTDVELDNLRDALVHTMTALDGKAAKTAFEPRVWRNENLVKPLTELMETVKTLSECTLVKHAESVPGGESYDPTVKLIRLCAGAMQTNDPNDFAALKSFNPEEDDTEPEDLSYLSHVTFQTACKLRASTLKWLQDLNGSGGAPQNAKEAIENDMNNNFMWVILPFTPFPRIAQILMIPFQPSKWNLGKFIWAVEYALGFIALFCLSIYVTGWRDLGIGTDDSLYAGWHLLGYAFAWTPTVEGTTKKAFSRAFGTAFGGFVAWVGVIVCSWSYDDADPMNPYGTVAYITVFVLIATLFGIDEGPAAMFGSSHDHGALSLYFSMNLALVMLEVYSGSGDKNTITINRIVATVTGVIMAVIIQLIPPHVMGTDFTHTDKFLKSLKDAFVDILEQMTKDDSQHDYELEQKHVAKAKDLGDIALFLLKDADTLQCLPLYRVHDKHQALLEDMLVTCAFMNRLIDFIRANEKDMILFSERLPLLEEVIADLKEDGEGPIRPGSGNLPTLPTGVVTKNQKAQICSYSTELILLRLNKHEEVIKSMKGANGK